MGSRTSQTKILSPTRLSAALKRLRQGRGKKPRVVFTNGCFDLLHAGHIHYLEKARSLGDRLVLALNADASVRKIKGPTRPVNPLGDRMRVIAALGCVDYVTWFTEPTPLKLIQKLRPDVLVKGGDWKPEQIVGGKEVRGWGGSVKSLPFLKGRSTTGILAKI